MKKEMLVLVEKVIKYAALNTFKSASLFRCYEPKISEGLKMAVKNNKYNKIK